MKKGRETEIVDFVSMVKDKEDEIVDFVSMVMFYILSVVMVRVSVNMGNILFLLFFGALAFLSLFCLLRMFWEFVRRNQDEEYKRN